MHSDNNKPGNIKCTDQYLAERSTDSSRHFWIKLTQERSGFFSRIGWILALSILQASMVPCEKMHGSQYNACAFVYVLARLELRNLFELTRQFSSLVQLPPVACPFGLVSVFELFTFTRSMDMPSILAAT